MYEKNVNDFFPPGNCSPNKPESNRIDTAVSAVSIIFSNVGNFTREVPSKKTDSSVVKM